MTGVRWWSGVAHLLQGSAAIPFLSLDDLLALAISPLVIAGIVLFVFENVLGAAEYRAAGAAGIVLAGLAVIVPADLNFATAAALRREFGWRIGFQVGRPIALYWGLWAVLLLMGAHEMWQEASRDR